ncbi:MAG TPA: ferrochelatase [Burkholderiales bacterium]|nr:ferrochelatase [Burkholderiales bacterium]
MRSYLAEFLSDPRVVKLPRWLWLPVLKLIVLKTRPERSAEKYSQIWMTEGSPLAVYTARQARLLEERTGLPVRYAMRYGEPRIGKVLNELEDPIVLPLYPQYSESTTASVADVLPPGVPMLGHFHDHAAYIDALAANVRRHWSRHGHGAKLVMSFHGLPKRGSERYERECRTTARLLSETLKTEYLVTFQSRFGYAEWLQPYTEPTLIGLARQGMQRVDVVCPGFVSDCLETLEEIGITARRAFLAAGGREFYLVSCLNDATEWIEALAALAGGIGNSRASACASDSGGSGRLKR